NLRWAAAERPGDAAIAERCRSTETGAIAAGSSPCGTGGRRRSAAGGAPARGGGTERLTAVAVDSSPDVFFDAG
ncbi:MAG: hypothetical protein ACO3EP_08070, partial [Phycisphaerales bacterium]